MSAESLITIGIPTYNRSALLQEALASALKQSLRPKIIVSDNCSTDDTEAVMRGYGDQVKYVRNASNIGPTPNFCRLLELCETPYFGWLQDDDGLHQDFVARAAAALRTHPQAKIYMAYALMSPSPDSQHFPMLYGPPFALDWLGSKPARPVDGRLISPLSLFASIAIPPTLIFHTETLRLAMQRYVENPLFGERTILAYAASQNSILVEPYVGGFFRIHDKQGHREVDRVKIKHDLWRAMALELHELAKSWDADWEDSLRSEFATIALDHRVKWLKETVSWPADIPFCVRIAQLLRDSMPPEKARAAIAAASADGRESSTKRALRSLTPPLVWKLGAQAKNLLRQPRGGSGHP